MIGPAAAVLSTVHYQAKIVLTCFGSNCFGNFPKPGANHRINVTRVSCYMRGPDGSTYEWGEVELQDETDVTLPLDSAGGPWGQGGTHGFNTETHVPLHASALGTASHGGRRAHG